MNSVRAKLTESPTSSLKLAFRPTKRYLDQPSFCLLGLLLYMQQTQQVEEAHPSLLISTVELLILRLS
jgi:hypothetical protein